MDRASPILEKLGGLRTNTLEKAAFLLDVRDIDIERFCNSMLRHASFNRLQNHSVFLNCGKPIDAFVVGECLIVRRDETSHTVDTEFFQNLDPEMAIKEQELAIFRTVSSYDWWFNDTDVFNRGGNLAVLSGISDALLELLDRQDVRQIDEHAFGFECHADIA